MSTVLLGWIILFLQSIFISLNRNNDLFLLLEDIYGAETDRTCI